MSEKLKQEWPAILHWMIDGCLEWRRIGLAVPDIVKRATDDYLSDQDTLEQWDDEWLDKHDPHVFTLTRALFRCWRQWCDERNLSAGTETTFAESLSDRGYEQKRKNFGRGFVGIALKTNNALSWEEAG